MQEFFPLELYPMLPRRISELYLVINHKVVLYIEVQWRTLIPPPMLCMGASALDIL